MEALRDANGCRIVTDLCQCGRPKAWKSPRCCAGCESGKHMTGCNLRCATMGLPGFGVRGTDRPSGRVVWG